MAEKTTTPVAETASSCCAPEAQSDCCEPDAKAACCREQAATGSCGCAAGADAEAGDVREVVRERYAAAALAGDGARPRFRGPVPTC